MSLDVMLRAMRETDVFDYNITHNLANMARAAKIYDTLWHPEKAGYTTAKQLIAPLKAG